MSSLVSRVNHLQRMKDAMSRGPITPTPARHWVGWVVLEDQSIRTCGPCIKSHFRAGMDKI